MERVHNIEDIHFDGDMLCLTIDGKGYRFNLKECSSALLKATQKERNQFVISGSGYGIHWPLVDEDLSIDGLMGVTQKSDKLTKV